jgi:hypothetical protein
MAPDDPKGEVAATLHTIDTGGILLTSKVCSTLKFKTEEHPPLRPSRRPTLSGEVELDCHANGSHITAHITFERCEY